MFAARLLDLIQRSVLSCPVSGATLAEHLGFCLGRSTGSRHSRRRGISMANPFGYVLRPGFMLPR